MRQDIKKKRGGFTLIEVILAIVVVAVIMGIVIPKVMSNSDKAQIKQVISSDVRSIIEAAADWKRTDQTNANGTYTSIKASYLNSRLPSNMSLNANNQIKSSGFNGGCIYGLVKSKITTDGDSFKIAMDCTTAKDNLNWNSKLLSYAKEAFTDTVKSIGGTSTATSTGDPKPDNIDCGGANASCVEKVSQ